MRVDQERAGVFHDEDEGKYCSGEGEGSLFGDPGSDLRPLVGKEQESAKIRRWLYRSYHPINSSRVTGACPVTTDLITRVNVRKTTEQIRPLFMAPRCRP